MSNPTQSRPYQGYPYLQPAIIDAPSISSAEAGRWQHLPRKPVTPVSTVQPGPSTARDELEEIAEKSVPAIISQPQKKTESEPVVYIDIPETTDTRRADEASQSREHFVEETIFYDPFEDRIIYVNKSESREGDSTPDSPKSLKMSNYTVEPTISTTSASSQEVQSLQTSVLPFMSKEAYIYAQQSPVDDGLRLSPLPVSSPPEYPDPPPAYTEVDVRRLPELPRTEVIVSETSTVARVNANRKLILCPYCGRRVLTLVVRESGILTHVLGTIFLFACFPITICIYCTDWCKYRNHYCPQCNHLIAYEVPILCQDMVYNKV